jgi:tetratricopeptide (TPR) repeat protein
LLSTAQGRAALALGSASGPQQQLDALRLARLRRDAHTAFRHNDRSELTWLGRVLWELDRALAQRALTRAMQLESANAALALGIRLDGIAADDNQDPATRSAARDDSIGAFKRGAELGDSVCAWWLAGIYRDRHQPELAMAAYRRAFDLKDVDAAHQLGFALEESDPDQAVAFYEEGIRRGDPLSALFLARVLKYKSRDLEKTDVAGSAQLRARAVDLYGMAFAMGEVSAAPALGDMYRETGDIGRARQAYVGGARLRDAESALKLGELAEEEEEDADAARSAYGWAIRLDTLGAIAATARYRLGGLLEKEARTHAAMRHYREAMGMPRSEIGSAKAAVACARLLEKSSSDWQAVDAAYRRGMELEPGAVAEAYVDFMKRRDRTEEALALFTHGVEKFSADALCRLGDVLRSAHPAEARETYRLALRAGSAPAALALYKLSLDGNGSDAQSIIEIAAGKGYWFTVVLADLFETEDRSIAAVLRTRAKGLRDRAL